MGSTLYEPGAYADGDSDFEEVHTAPLAEFFSAFANFSLNPTAASTDEFKRLLSTVGNENARELREDFKEALVSEFIMAYGKTSSLSAWRSLCGDIGIDPIPATLPECRIAVENSFVNIIDLLDARKTGTKVHRFASLKELADYTKDTRRFFPGDRARGTLLRELLREIFGPGSEKRRRRRKTKVPRDTDNSQQQKESGQAGGKRKRRNRARRRARALAKLARSTAAATETASAPPANEVSV